MHIRPTKETDTVELSAMMIAAWRDSYALILSVAKLEEICSVWLTPEKFLERVHKAGAFSFVAVVDGVIVGHLFAEYSSARNLNIAYLYVGKSFLRRGIGARLLKHLVEESGKATSLSLGVFRDNSAAIEFYETQGFSAAEEDNRYDWKPGEPVNLKMKKLL